MRTAYAQNAELIMATGADLGAAGAAVTVALCGHWTDEPPCPLAPHHTHAERLDDRVHLRTLFAVEPGRENEVRHRIVEALGQGHLRGADGVTTTWELRSTAASPVLPTETAHAERLQRA